MLKINKFLNKKITSPLKLSSRLDRHQINNQKIFKNETKVIINQSRNYSFESNDSSKLNDSKYINGKKRFAKSNSIELTDLGLEKYAKLFEENLIGFGKDEDEEDSWKSVKYFEKFLNSREFKELNVEMYEELIDSDEKREEIKQILKDYELEKYNTSQVPSELTVNDMKELLELKNDRDQLKHFNFLFKREAKKVTRKIKKGFDKVETEKRLKEKFSMTSNRTGLEFNKEGLPVYAKWKNTMFISFNNESLRKESERRIRDAILFGPSLVIDFGFPPKVMDKRAYSTFLKQLSFLFGENQTAKTPFFLNFCNFPKESNLYNYFKKFLPYIFEPNSLINITENSYLDLYPKEDLVYLSSDAPQVLERVDPTKVHIIGCNFDKFNKGPYSLDKANADEIKVYRLPLDEYFFFKHDRILPINLVFGILSRYLETEDWRKAFISKIPIRKLKTPEELKLEQMRKINRFHKREKLIKIYKLDELKDQHQLYKPNYNPTSNIKFNKYSPPRPNKRQYDFKKNNQLDNY